MGIFYERSEAVEGGKRFLVLKAKPLAHLVFLLLFVLYFIFFMVIKISGVRMTITFLNYLFAFTGILMLFIVIRLVETRGANFAGMMNKKVIKKGANNISFKNPAEVWVEKKD